VQIDSRTLQATKPISFARCGGIRDALLEGMETRKETRQAPREPAKQANGGDIERWEVDGSRSRLRFSLRHIVVQQIQGSFRTWGGTLYLDREEPTLSSLDIWVDLASIETGSVERDDHVRSPEFLDVGRHPRAEFKSTSVEIRNGTAVVHGLLQLHGVTHDLDLEIRPASGPSDAVPAYLVAAKLDRQSFDLHWNQDLDFGGVVVGDEVALTAEVKVVSVDDHAAGRRA
jgi:polyisoprenoid-binding protein YceI